MKGTLCCVIRAQLFDWNCSQEKYVASIHGYHIYHLSSSDVSSETTVALLRERTPCFAGR